MTPLLRQEWNLTPSDLEKVPIWMCVHGNDQDEKWYQACDESTFRPWDGSTQALTDRLLLVRVSMILTDRRQYVGVCYSGNTFTLPNERSRRPIHPTAEDRQVRQLQPRMFAENRLFAFWGGLGGIPSADRQAFYSTLNGSAETIFPISFDADLEGLSTSPKGLIRGFFRLLSDDSVVVETSSKDSVEANSEGGNVSVAQTGTVPEYDLIVRLLQECKFQEALSNTEALIALEARNGRWWQLKSLILGGSGDSRGSLAAAKAAVDCEPTNGGFYVGVCKRCAEIKDFEACLAYSDLGWDTVRSTPYFEIVAFYGARALYELGRPEMAVERLRWVLPGFAFGKSGDPLMTRAGLLRACKARPKKG